MKKKKEIAQRFVWSARDVKITTTKKQEEEGWTKYGKTKTNARTT